MLKKIKRRLIEEEREALEERRNDLNKKEEVRRFENAGDDRALTLKEAYDRAVWKVGQSKDAITDNLPTINLTILQ